MGAAHRRLWQVPHPLYRTIPPSQQLHQASLPIPLLGSCRQPATEGPLSTPAPTSRRPGSQPLHARPPVPACPVWSAFPESAGPPACPAGLQGREHRAAVQHRAESPQVWRPEHIRNYLGSPKTGNGQRSPSAALGQAWGLLSRWGGSQGHLPSQRGEVTAPGPRSALGAQKPHSFCTHAGPASALCAGVLLPSLHPCSPGAAA